ncbi:hypothetical protein P8452_26309 [Trifolium repens]|nr:hypothetical protein P8452_26309 [Trifolium repens]
MHAPHANAPASCAASRSQNHGKLVRVRQNSNNTSLLVIRISSDSLCFANANVVRERILKWVTEENGLKETTIGNVQAIILDMTNLMNVDTSGIIFAMVNQMLLVIHKLKVAKCLQKISGDKGGK